MSPAQTQPDVAAAPMPVVFVGHGSPMNAIEDTRFSRGFAELGTLVPKPKAILAVSAHWYIPGTYLTGNARPRTIHDFSGFPPELHQVSYPAPGSVDLAQKVRTQLGHERAELSADWGLDHGTWSVLRWMFPSADIPVVQLSIDRRLKPEQHYALARSLTELREQGVLIFGSGNVVHNLRDALGRGLGARQEPPIWASRFDETVRSAAVQHDDQALVRLLSTSKDALLAHPTPDHWLPLLYSLAATGPRDRVRFPIEGFDLGSISMRSILWG